MAVVPEEFRVVRTVRTAMSEALHRRAERCSPGGCAAGNGRFYAPFPLYFRKSEGSKLWDVDGNEYLDFQGGPGPHVLGHNHPEITEALIATMRSDGVFLGQPHPSQVALAEVVCEVLPSAEMTMFSGGGGTDPLFHTVRVSKAYTGRRKVLKLEGGFHGWQDWCMVSIMPKPEEMGPYEHPTPIPSTAGIPPQVLENTVLAHANDEAFLERVVTREKDNLACIVVEPVLHGLGVLKLNESFLRLARQLCDAFGIVLVFDELLTGFRHDIGGVQRLVGVTPDLTAFGKAWSNGAAVLSGIAGKREIMSQFTPAGQVRLSGSYGANLMGVTAALKCIEILQRDAKAIYPKLFRQGDMLREGINRAAEKLGARARCHSFGSIWTVYPFSHDISNYRDIVRGAAPERHQAFARALCTWFINHGIFVSPADGLGRAFISAAHTDEDIARVIDATESFFVEHRAALR